MRLINNSNNKEFHKIFQIKNFVYLDLGQKINLIHQINKIKKQHLIMENNFLQILKDLVQLNF